MPRRESPHRVALRRLSLEPATAARLESYLDTLAEWSRRVNLTGARTPDERVSRLVEAVWPLVEIVPAGRLIDVGSGNGSPGLVLALARDDLDVTLIEPEGPIDGVHHVADSDDAGERNTVEISSHVHEHCKGQRDAEGRRKRKKSKLHSRVRAQDRERRS